MKILDVSKSYQNPEDLPPGGFETLVPDRLPLLSSNWAPGKIGQISY